MSRPNRFLAHVLMDGQDTLCHVKNTGRCRELLLPGAPLSLQESQNPTRKTRYDVIAVQQGADWINIDSQAPNQVAPEWLPRLFDGITLLKPEVTFSHSRFDFYLETAAGTRGFVEVKGCTLRRNGVALFPDAPTERGVRHLQELIACKQAGYAACLLLIIQMRGVHCFSPNEETHPAFGEALRQAARAGVRIEAVDCDVQPDSLLPHGSIPVLL